MCNGPQRPAPSSLGRLKNVFLPQLRLIGLACVMLAVILTRARTLCLASSPLIMASRPNLCAVRPSSLATTSYLAIAHRQMRSNAFVALSCSTLPRMRHMLRPTCPHTISNRWRTLSTCSCHRPIIFFSKMCFWPSFSTSSFSPFHSTKLTLTRFQTSGTCARGGGPQCRNGLTQTSADISTHDFAPRAAAVECSLSIWRASAARCAAP